MPSDNKNKTLFLCDPHYIPERLFNKNLISLGQWVDGLAETKELDFKFLRLNEPIRSKKEIEAAHEYVSKIYNIFLAFLSKELNHYHNENISIRGWEIIIGPWLKIFIDSFFYRWELISKTLELDFDRVVFIDKDIHKMPPPISRKDFVNSFIDSPYWNQHITSSIYNSIRKDYPFLNNEKINDYNKVKVKSQKIISLNLVKNNTKNFIKIAYNFLVNSLFSFIKNKELMVFDASYFSLRDKFRIAKELNKRPFFYTRKAMKYEFQGSISRHIFSNFYKEMGDKFSVFLAKNLSNYFPVIYLEGWKKLNKKSLKINIKADSIFLSSFPDDDEVFRVFIARQIEKNCKLIITQHGGIYGLSVIPLKGEFIEHNVADKWISWGWSSGQKVIAGQNIHLLGREKLLSNPKGKLMMVLPSIDHIKIRLYHREPSLISSYLNNFVKNLDTDIVKKFIIRPKPSQHNTPFFDKLKKEYDISTLPNFYNSLDQVKLIVNTSFSTTTFESIGLNFPTIIVLTEYEQLQRDQNKKIFQMLFDAKVVFFDFNQAAQHVNKIWDNVNAWWFSPIVQTSVSVFSDKYTRNSKFIIHKILMN